MKKKLLTILITSLVMIAAIGGFLWKMNSMSQKIAKNQEALLAEELDVDTSEKAWKEVKDLELNKLYLSGGRKNVITRDYKGISEIYNPEKSAEAEKLLTDVKKKGSYSKSSPLWAYNPYGTNPDSLYVYFQTKGKCYCRYTISVKDGAIPDFTRTLNNGSSGNVTNEHEYQIIGLVPGKTNYIIMKLYNSKDELADTLYYQVDMPKSYSGAQVQLDTETGRSKVSLSNGLYMVFQDAPAKKVTKTKTVTKKVKKKGKTVRKKVTKKVKVTQRNNAILLYDNSGILRGEIPTGIRGYHAEIIYDNLVYACDKDSLAQINELGQVMGRLDMPSYRQYGEFAYDGAGAVYVLAEPVKKRNTLGTVVKISVNSGEMSEAVDLSQISALSSLYTYRTGKSKAKGKNQLAIDALQVVGTNQLLLSSEKYSAIFKISNANSLMPKLDYVLTDVKLWNISGKSKAQKRLRRKILTKALAEGQEAPAEETPLVNSILDTTVEETELFDSQYGQSGIVLEQTASGEEGTSAYSVYMLNNNTGTGSSKNNKNSYYYRYQIDENAGTYVLEEKQRVEKNTTGGNVTPLEEGLLYCRAAQNLFQEEDTDGKLIQSYKTKQNLYRVTKSDWKGFWFY
jgi:hypothetical protein